MSKAEMHQTLPYAQMAEIAAALAEKEDFLGSSPMLLFREKKRCFKTAQNADFSALKETDILDCTDFSLPEKDTLLSLDDRCAMLLCQPPYLREYMKEETDLPAPLDDTAQIIGPSARFVESNTASLRKALKDSNGALLKGGGALTAGRTLREVRIAMEVLEKAAEVTLKGRSLGGVKALDPANARQQHQGYLTKYSRIQMDADQKAARAGAGKMAERPISDTAADARPVSDSETNIHPMSEREITLRTTMVEYGKKMVEEGLVQGTWGNLSARLNEEYILVTPSGRDYAGLTPADMVKVHIKTLSYEGPLKPTMETSLHTRVYERQPEAGAIIHNHSAYCSMYAACHMPLEVEDPLLRKDLGDVLPIAEYDLAGTEKLAENVAQAMDKKPGVLLANHGMMASGKDMVEAYEICRKMESAAKDAIERRYSQTQKEAH